jgi:hypothetical protein
MVGVHGKWVFLSQADTSPYAILGTGAAIAHSDGFSHFDETGTWHYVKTMETRPYIFWGAGLDRSVSSRVSLFGAATFNILLWRGSDLRSDVLTLRLDQEYFYFDLAAGLRLRLWH